MAQTKNIPNHVAIIMDGNGRWAQSKNKMRTFGHKAGAEVIGTIVKAAINQNVKILSLFAFSCENWERPKAEVNFIMQLLQKYLDDDLIEKLNKHKIQLRWIGLKDKMYPNLLDKIQLVQAATKHNKKIILNICFNYGGMQDILQAAQKAKNVESINEFSKLLLTQELTPVDLLIRTGNEKRISNFLLWQSAYAEIIFEPTYWPAYNEKLFSKNLLEYSSRSRHFGKIN